MKLSAPIPIFRMFDEDKAREFYLDYLGFKTTFEHRFHEGAPLFMGIVRDGCEMYLSEHVGDATPGSSVRIEVKDLKKFHSHLPDYKYYKPSIMDQTWGCWEMPIIDPFGNTLIFFEDKPAT